MSDDETVLAALADIRQPALSQTALWSEALLALGLGLLLALGVVAILRLVTEPRVAKTPSLKARIGALANLPKAARLPALVRLAQQTGKPVPKDIRAALYRPVAEDEAARLADRFEADLRGS